MKRVFFVFTGCRLGGMKTLYIVEGANMENGFIVFAVSKRGVERVKIFHTGKSKDITEVLELYQRINPDLQRLESKIRRVYDGYRSRLR